MGNLTNQQKEILKKDLEKTLRLFKNIGKNNELSLKQIKKFWEQSEAKEHNITLKSQTISDEHVKETQPLLYYLYYDTLDF